MFAVCNCRVIAGTPAGPTERTPGMPNYISTKLTIHSDAAQVFAAIGGTDADGADVLIDFGKIVPIPPHIAHAGLDAGTKQVWGRGNGWHGWSVRNWGTKWNAYRQRRLGPDAVSFETAWGAAEPVFDALAVRFPGVAFTVAYAGEDIGVNAGLLRYDGTRKLHRLLSGPDAARLWFSLHPGAEPAE